MLSEDPAPRVLHGGEGMGLTAIDLVTRKTGTFSPTMACICSMAWHTSPGGIPNGLNDPANHDEIVRRHHRRDAAAKKAGVPNIICLLRQPQRHVRRRAHRELRHRPQPRSRRRPRSTSVTICMELLNSKVDHKDYMCDRTAWGVEL